MIRLPSPHRAWFALLIIITVSLAACSLVKGPPDRSLARIQEAGRLRVGIDPSYPPFANVDGQQRLVGYDVDLANELARRLGVEVVLVPIDVGTIFDGLLARKYDVVVSAIPPYPELTREVAFSEPYFNAGQVMLMGREISLREPRELTRGTLAVELGSSAEVEARILARAASGLALRTLESPQVVLEQLEQGIVDAAVVDRVTAMEYLAVSQRLAQVGQPLSFEPYVMAVRRPDATLLEAVNAAIRELQKDGFLASLEKKWLG